MATCCLTRLVNHAGIETQTAFNKSLVDGSGDKNRWQCSLTIANLFIAQHHNIGAVLNRSLNLVTEFSKCFSNARGIIFPAI